METEGCEGPQVAECWLGRADLGDPRDMPKAGRFLGRLPNEHTQVDGVSLSSCESSLRAFLIATILPTQFPCLLLLPWHCKVILS